MSEIILTLLFLLLLLFLITYHYILIRPRIFVLSKLLFEAYCDRIKIWGDNSYIDWSLLILNISQVITRNTIVNRKLLSRLFKIRSA